MMNLTFGEQVKIVLSRKGMTIKRLAEEVEKYTGKPMSRQNMTQRLGRDNFQEQDMRMIAEILGCKFTLSILDDEELPPEKPDTADTRDITVGELVPKEKDMLRQGIKGYFRNGSLETGIPAKEEKEKPLGEINPYTQREYESNSVRMHPKKIGYVQVYDRDQHKWTDMTEWAFLGYQERKKQLLGKDYKPPIYLD